MLKWVFDWVTSRNVRISRARFKNFPRWPHINHVTWPLCLHFTNTLYFLCNKPVFCDNVCSDWLCFCWLFNSLLASNFISDSSSFIRVRLLCNSILVALYFEISPTFVNWSLFNSSSSASMCKYSPTGTDDVVFAVDGRDGVDGGLLFFQKFLITGRLLILKDSNLTKS